MKLSKELRTGLIAMIAIAVIIWGYNYLKKQSLFETSRVYYSEFEDIHGLTLSSIVTINGFQVGNITNISFNPKKKGSLIVSYTLNTDFSFSDQSSTIIKPAALIGSTELVIIPSYEGENAISGTYLKGEIEQGMIASLTDKLAPTNQKLNEVLANVNQLLKNLNNTLDTNTQQNIKAAIAKINISLNSFKNASNSLDEMLTENKTKIGSILANADSASQNLKAVTLEFKKADLSNSLKQTMTKLDKSLTSFDRILQKAEKGDGSIAKLLNDDGLYTNLENASKEMEELLREMKEHPKRFVHFSLFGKKDKRGYIKDTVK